ncbi:MAG: class I SAM-dependent methyltransferase [Anaerolineales bacterium]
MSVKPQVILRPAREKSLLRRHPWIFASAIAEVRGDPSPGATVEVMSSTGEFLAQAAFSPQSQIRARVWTWDREEIVDGVFFHRRLERAIHSRSSLDQESNACRLVNAESDGLPGIVVDKYGDALVLQCLNWGAEAWRDTLVEALVELVAPATLYERSDADVRGLEGLPPRVGTLRGTELPGPITISEHGLDFLVDIQKGHKSGFYLDQRANRLTVRPLAEGRQVLDCFSYTGGFAVNALKGGAKSVTLVEDSRDALALAKQNIELNKLPADKAEFIDGDAFQVLRRFRDAARQFDMVILDPPKFAPTKAQAERAARGYKDINLLAFKLLRPGGLLFTFSCSGGIDAALFQKIVAGAALDAGVDARILQRLSQGPDHTVALNFPEGDYLKGLVVEVG